MTTPQLSIVMPCFNEGAYIQASLEALLEQECIHQFEIIVADNGSTDLTREVVRKLQAADPRIQLVDASARKGAAAARNMGVQAAKGEMILFIDADDEASDQWMSKMASGLERFPIVGCGFDTISLNESWQSESWQNGQDGALNNFDPPFLPWSGAGALGVLRSTHLGVNGFDESLLVLEDADYCWRVQLTGAQMGFVNDAYIRYRFPKKYSQMYRQMRKLGQYHALVYRRYAHHGMPRIQQPIGRAWQRWRRWFRKLRRARTKAQRATLVRDLGWNIGRLYGSLRYRTMDF
ncbi:MAG: glycosyltransferase [Pseudomonadota bacterium]